jgi:ribosomal protein L2
MVLQGRYQNLIDPVAIHIHNLESQVTPGEMIRCAGDMAQLQHDESANGVKISSRLVR